MMVGSELRRHRDDDNMTMIGWIGWSKEDDNDLMMIMVIQFRWL